MSTFARVWADLTQAGGPMPYLLIDCAGLEGGLSRIPRDAFAELECLFTGDLAVELADVGPYLGQLRSYEPEVEAVVLDLLESQVAILVVLQEVGEEGAEVTFSQLHRHFRKFNVVYDPGGKPLFFRYYDPRILPVVLSVFAPEQVISFFGPIETLVFIDQGNKVTRSQRKGSMPARLS